MAEEKTVTMNKGTYNKLLGGLVIALIAIAFSSGYILGGVGGITGQITAQPGGSAAGSDSGDGSPSLPDSGVPQRLSLKADDPGIGSANAPIKIFEWSDFQCPFCRRSYSDYVSTDLKTEYLDTGKVQLIYKDFPLSFHEGAEPFALAAECANEQGLWEEAHNKIYDEQNTGGPGTIPYAGDETLKQWMQEIGLNMNQFNSCFDAKKYQSEIDADFQDGAAAGVSGTPTFFIGNNDIGYEMVVGAQPYSVIKQAIEQQLAAA